MSRGLLFIFLLFLMSQNCHSHSKGIAFITLIDYSSIIVVAEFIGKTAILLGYAALIYKIEKPKKVIN